VLSGAWQEQWGYQAATRLLTENRRVDGLFCASDQIARGAVDALREYDVRVPDDVAVVGFDNWDVMALATRPPLTSVDMNLHDLGRYAGTRLLAMIAGERETGIVRLPCRLVIRESCGAGAPAEPMEEGGMPLPTRAVAM
jgi:LacI family transcriptional regulator